MPVIVLSAAGSEQRKVSAFDGGADDYVTKPFGMAELEARIRAALRHRATPDCADRRYTSSRWGELHLDLVHHEARVDGKLVELTSKEFDILAFLARHAGRLCTHKMILEQVWGPGYGTESQYLRVYVYRLRRKLGDEGGDLLRDVSRDRLHARRAGLKVVGRQIVRDSRGTRRASYPGVNQAPASGRCDSSPDGRCHRFEHLTRRSARPLLRPTRSTAGKQLEVAGRAERVDSRHRKHETDVASRALHRLRTARTRCRRCGRARPRVARLRP